MRNDQELQSDGRERGSYQTRYPECYRKKIKGEAIYISVLLLGSILGIFFNYLGWFEKILHLENDKAIIFHKVAYCVCSGLMGGATFSIKYFYRVVARGYWNEDRRYWRIMSPWISIPLSVVMAAIMVKDVSSSSAFSVTIGFLTGYFSDEAVSKMYDVACVLFLKTDQKYVNNPDKIEKTIAEQQKEEKNNVDS